MEHGKIIRDLVNENNSAEQELEDYFNAGVEEAIENVAEEEAENIVEEVDEKVEVVEEAAEE